MGLQEQIEGSEQQARAGRGGAGTAWASDLHWLIDPTAIALISFSLPSFPSPSYLTIRAPSRDGRRDALGAEQNEVAWGRGGGGRKERTGHRAIAQRAGASGHQQQQTRNKSHVSVLRTPSIACTSTIVSAASLPVPPPRPAVAALLTHPSPAGPAAAPCGSLVCRSTTHTSPWQRSAVQCCTAKRTANLLQQQQQQKLLGRLTAPWCADGSGGGDRRAGTVVLPVAV